MRYAHFAASPHGRHAEVHFLTRYFYYLLLDPHRTAYYSAFARASTIDRTLCGRTLRVHRGMRWRTFVASV